ncbi:MAG: hypothetical protein LBF82_03205 [Lactobacillales bacterium]|jgi:hypothetical protein|nr:hypothetical protein [Lactobacillales bacterium]
MNKQFSLTILTSLLFFSLIFTNGMKVLADYSASTQAENTSTSKVKPNDLLGVRLDFVYDTQDDVKNTLKVVVYLIQEEKEVFAPIYKADNSQNKVSVKGNFYVEDKRIYTKNYSTNKSGELSIYLDEISALTSYKKGQVRVEIDPLTIGKVDLDQKKYHDKIYREFTLPIPKRSEKSSVDDEKQEDNEGRTMMSILIEAIVVGSAALILGYLIGRLHAKRRFKKKTLQQEKNKKFETVPTLNADAVQVTEQNVSASHAKDGREVEPLITSKKDPEQILVNAEENAKEDATNHENSSSQDDNADPLDQLKALRKHAQQLLKEV